MVTIRLACDIILVFNRYIDMPANLLLTSAIEQPDEIDAFINEELSDAKTRQNLERLINFRDKMESNFDLWSTKFGNQLFAITEFQRTVLDRIFNLRSKYNSILENPEERTYVADEGATTHLLADGIHPDINTTDKAITLGYPRDLYTIINTLGVQRRQLPLRSVDIPFDDLRLFFVPRVTGGFGLGSEFMSMKNNVSLYAEVVAFDENDRILITPYNRSTTMIQLDGVNGLPKVVLGETRLSTLEFCMKSGVPNSGIQHWSGKQIRPNMVLTPYTGGYGFDGRNGSSALSTLESGYQGDVEIPNDLRARMMIYLFANSIGSNKLPNGPELIA